MKLALIAALALAPTADLENEARTAGQMLGMSIACDLQLTAQAESQLATRL